MRPILLVFVISSTTIISGHFCSVNKTDHERQFEQDIIKYLFDDENPTNTTSVDTVSKSRPIVDLSTYQSDHTISGENEIDHGTETIDIEQLKSTMLDIFVKPRHHSNPTQKESAKTKILNLFESFGIETKVQTFQTTIEEENSVNSIFGNFFGSPTVKRTVTGQNLIGILPSKNRGKPGDQLIVFGAHWDTVKIAPGVDDNGSGSVAVLEAARVLAPFSSRLGATILFVLFDLEEYVCLT